MRMVINLDEEVYNHIKQFGYFPTTYTQYIANAIFDGKLIPKECGRLIDANALDKGIREQQKSYEHTFGLRQPINEAVRDGIIIARTHIEHAPTIIENDGDEK